ncbi:MAG: YIP1 family protein, partial [Anaeromyxobacteraceae bacterium]
MLARCARCQGTFQADRFGVQTCPHCGGEVLLSDPNAPQQGVGDPATPAGGAPPPAAPPSAPSASVPP